MSKIPLGQGIEEGYEELFLDLHLKSLDLKSLEKKHFDENNRFIFYTTAAEKKAYVEKHGWDIYLSKFGDFNRSSYRQLLISVSSQMATGDYKGKMYITADRIDHLVRVSGYSLIAPLLILGDKRGFDLDANFIKHCIEAWKCNSSDHYKLDMRFRYKMDLDYLLEQYELLKGKDSVKLDIKLIDLFTGNVYTYFYRDLIEKYWNCYVIDSNYLYSDTEELSIDYCHKAVKDIIQLGAMKIADYGYQTVTITESLEVRNLMISKAKDLIENSHKDLKQKVEDYIKYNSEWKSYDKVANREYDYEITEVAYDYINKDLSVALKRIRLHVTESFNVEDTTRKGIQESNVKTTYTPSRIMYLIESEGLKESIESDFSLPF